MFYAVTAGAVLGRFVGAALAECGPVLYELIVRILKDATTDKMEVSVRDDDLRKRLLERVRQYNDLYSERRAREDSQTDENGSLDK